MVIYNGVRTVEGWRIRANGGYFQKLLSKGGWEKLQNFDNFQTTVAEIEAVINARPLTYVSDENFEILRPVDLLSPRAMPWTPTPHFKEDDVGYMPEKERRTPRGKLIEYWNRSQTEVERFWGLWSEEYMQLSQERRVFQHKCSKSATSHIPKQGEVVLIIEETKPRNQWQLARVEEVIKSEDGNVRSVTLKTPSGRRLKRPTNHIAFLELSERDD